MDIKKIRCKAGLTQTEFAEKIGVNYHTVMKWEKGKTTPSPMAQKAIEMVFKVKLDG